LSVSKFLKEDVTKAINLMMRETAMVACTLKMEDTMKANGKTIKCMVLVSCTMKMVKLLTRDIGKMINSMAKEESTTQSQFPSRDSSTTKTSLSLEIDGFTTKVNSKAIQSMVKAT
jgi:hypothetical protein